MGSKAVDGVISILVAIVGVATLAVVVSKNSQAPQVITNAGNAFSAILKAAVGPVVSGTLG